MSTKPIGVLRQMIAGLALLIIAGTIVLLALRAGESKPSLPPTLTHSPAEPATIYLGPSTDGLALVGVVAGQARARAGICSLDPTRWRTLDRWLGQGEVTTTSSTTTIAAHNGSEMVTGQYTGSTPPTTLSGTYHLADGTDHTFTASQYAISGQEGIYRLDNITLPENHGTALLIIFVTSVDSNSNASLCGMALQDDKPVSRLVLTNVWQGGFSTFGLLDLLNKDGKPLVLIAPGKLGHIDSIALPTSGTPVP